MLQTFDDLPPGLLEVEPPGLADALGGPALIRVPGSQAQPLFLSTLLHGNETTGWNALRRVLGGLRRDASRRPVLLFLGNVAAAREGLRHLDGQPDFNRIWCDAVGPEARIAAQVLAEVRRAAPVACIDVHNTSGENPVYACVHRLEPRVLALAARFGTTAVLVSHPQSMLSMALSPVAPSITLECGKPGNEAVTEAVALRLGELLAPGGLADDGAAGDTLRLLRSVARVRVADHVSFSFADADADLRFVPGLDRYNFEVMPAGTVVAHLRAGSAHALVATDDHGNDVSGRYFRRRGDTLIAAVPWIPSLFSSNERIVRQDCLCYAMEPL